MVKKAAMEGETTDQARAKASRTFKKRKDCVKKKTMELATLCGTKACVVCFGPNGELETWPENPSDVRAVLQMHDDYARNGRRGSKINDNAELKSVEAALTEKGFSGWEDRWLRGLSKEELANFLESVEDKLRGVEARIEFLEKITIEQQNWFAMNESYDEMAAAEMMIGSLWPQPLQAVNYESTLAEPAEFGYFGDDPMFAIGTSTWALLNCYGDNYGSSGCAWYW
ncbi:agamous-like MADS-box protein AGL103 [Diospyros lotus]|uniref:agamous-like MADS-box protein AGL103 n=1 Tax=Diospyros lotus TaxID=55363 RepID=UPI00225594E1|nr:agamous-like MADS-box protein AGL103 [Diospyros lotus]